MNRIKREFQRHGFPLEKDFEYLPCDGIETVVVDSEAATWKEYHVSAGWVGVRLTRSGDVVDL